MEHKPKNTTSTLVKMKIPLAPDQVKKYYNSRLTKYEQREILEYQHIYYVGACLNKKNERKKTKNYGYDDESGGYVHVSHDQVAYRYEVLKVIGKGSFGSVVKAFDHKNQQMVALKMVRNENRFHRQAIEEIKILATLRKKDEQNKMNVVHMFDHFMFRSHTCITFEMLSLNLYELSQKNKFAGFSVQLVRKFAYRMLKCLKALNELKIIHCDLKPENVLLKQQNSYGIKVIDFGSSCFEDQRMHTYIQSR